MFARATRQRALSQALAVLLLIAGWAVPLVLPHPGGDDPVCVLQQDESRNAARLSGGSPSATPADHCVLCHTARSFRSAPASSGRLTIDAGAGQSLDSPADQFGRAAFRVRLPARAPPA